MKNAMFQFYDGVSVVDDTGLITLDEALTLFDLRKNDFAKALSRDLDCQMCIWHECISDTDYRNAYKDWHSSNVKFDGKQFWVRD